MNTDSLAREIVAAALYLNEQKPAVPAHGHGLFAAIRARYEQKAGNVEGGSLETAAVELVKEKLDAALAAETPVAPVETSNPPLGDLPADEPLNAPIVPSEPVPEPVVPLFPITAEAPK